MTEPVDPYQNENSSFSGSGERPEQTEEQISKAFDVTEFMRDVIDPELGINVVDLGLVYDLWFEEDNGKEIVMINMTLTSPACPLTDVIAEQSKTSSRPISWPMPSASTGYGCRHGDRK